MRIAVTLWFFALAACSPNNAPSDAANAVDSSRDAATVTMDVVSEPSSGDASTPDAPDAPDAMDASDVATPCVAMSTTGDSSVTLGCARSLCRPTGGTIEILDLSSGGIIRPTIDGMFTARSYTGQDLSARSTFQYTVNNQTYTAVGGSMPLPGQQLNLVITSIREPASNPCDGEAHGTFDGTLVVPPDAGTTGMLTVHVTF